MTTGGGDDYYEDETGNADYQGGLNEPSSEDDTLHTYVEDDDAAGAEDYQFEAGDDSTTPALGTGTGSGSASGYESPGSGSNDVPVDDDVPSTRSASSHIRRLAPEAPSEIGPAPDEGSTPGQTTEVPSGSDAGADSGADADAGAGSGAAVVVAGVGVVAAAGTEGSRLGVASVGRDRAQGTLTGEE